MGQVMGQTLRLLSRGGEAETETPRLLVAAGACYWRPIVRRDGKRQWGSVGAGESPPFVGLNSTTQTQGFAAHEPGPWMDCQSRS